MKTIIPQKATGLNPNNFLPLRPHTLISLLDMIRFIAIEAVEAYQDMRYLINGLHDKKKANPAQLFTEQDYASVFLFLKYAELAAVKLDLIDTKKRIDRFKSEAKYNQRNVSEIYADMKGLDSALLHELCNANFAFIHSDKLKYFEQEKLFEAAVYDNFQSARADIKDAGNCRAADLHAAAMYHLMCIVNIGLIALARRLRVIIKKIPLEYAEWHTMIDKLEKKMKQKTVRPPGNNKMAQAEARTFYNGLLAEFKFFKDMRNDTMHAHNDYKESDVESAYIRVLDFMKRLAKAGISES
jgi:hypothetical protein